MGEKSDYKIFEVQQNSTLGRYLVASRDIDPGEIIIHENPLIRGPSQITGPVCLTCLQGIDEKKYQECDKCILAIEYCYCTCHSGWPLCSSGSCCRPSVADHQPECEWTVQKRGEKVKIKTFVTPHRTYECVTVIRCLYQKHKNPKLWEKLINLESHCDKRSGTDKYESDRMIIAQFLYRFFKIRSEEFSEGEILKICGIVEINGHEVPLTEPPHVAVFEITSMLEHNCSPNTCKTFLSDGSLIIRATSFIKKGQHISICYTDPLWNTFNRREHLLVTKFFYCQCPRCADPTELGTYYSALNCFNKQCDGFLIPHILESEESASLPQPDWKCTVCKKVEDKDRVIKVLYRIGQDYSLTDKQNISSCETFLKHYGVNKLLHPNHYFLSDVRLKLAQLYGQTIERDIAGLSDAELEAKLEVCRQALDFASTLYPAEWRIRGVLKFELHAALAEDARRKTMSGLIDTDTLRSKLLESKTYLEDTIFCLKYEPEILPEGKIVKQGEKNLIDLETLLMNMYFQM